MKWCNPCALVWVVICSVVASHIWLNVHWSYFIVAAVVLVPVVVVFVRREGEDIYFTLQGIVNEVWWLLKNRTGEEPKNRIFGGHEPSTPDRTAGY